MQNFCFEKCEIFFHCVLSFIIKILISTYISIFKLMTDAHIQPA